MSGNRRRRPVGARAAAALVAVVALTGCTGEILAPPTAQDEAPDGGTLTLLSAGPAFPLDPQRVGDLADAALVGRALHRTLTAYAPASGGATQAELVGDLATDTGQPSEDRRTWKFTIRSGTKWEDGSPVTCEDVRHGVARTFATDVVTGGTTDAVAVLAIPRTPDGRSTFLGPWATGAEADAGRAAFDQAVSCAGSTVNFLLSEPVADFNEMVTLPAFAPVKKDATAAPGQLPEVISSGPYRVDGTWDAEKGGLLVRNPHWDREHDAVRRAHPDRIRVLGAQDGARIVEAVLSDRPDTRGFVSLTPAPPSLQQQVEATEPLRRRSVISPTERIDYLVPSVASPAFATQPGRAALAAATDRAAYAIALAGPSTVRPQASVIPSGLLARATSAVDVPAADPARARALLVTAGLTPPVPIRVAYRPGPTADKGMAALVASWRQGGFEPTLVPIKDDYYATISAPGANTTHDVFWSTWLPAWGSASTVLPPLFDSSFNLTAAGTGRDYGGWANSEWNANVRTVAAMPDRLEREKAWAAADDALLEDVAYIGLAERYAVHLAGSGVRGLWPHPHGSGTIDIGVIGVASE